MNTHPTPETAQPLGMAKKFSRPSLTPAEARWAERLGLTSGETPVSMVDTVLHRQPDGTWQVGG